MSSSSSYIFWQIRGALPLSLAEFTPLL